MDLRKWSNLISIFFKRAAQPPTSSPIVKNDENRLPDPFTPHSTLHLGEITMDFSHAKKIRTHEIQRLHPLEKPLGHFERGKKFVVWDFCFRLVENYLPKKLSSAKALPASNLEDKFSFSTGGGRWRSSACGWIWGWLVEEICATPKTDSEAKDWDWKIMFAHPCLGRCLGFYLQGQMQR